MKARLVTELVFHVSLQQEENAKLRDYSTASLLPSLKRSPGNLDYRTIFNLRNMCRNLLRLPTTEQVKNLT